MGCAACKRSPLLQCPLVHSLRVHEVADLVLFQVTNHATFFSARGLVIDGNYTAAQVTRNPLEDESC